MNRREFAMGAAALAAPTGRADFDGRSYFIADREYALADILAPATSNLRDRPDAGAQYTRAALDFILNAGRPGVASGKVALDRWGRAVGPTPWLTEAGGKTSIEELMIASGAARVLPETKNLDALENLFVLERRARDANRGNWRLAAWAVQDAAAAKPIRGFAIWRGVIRQAAENNARIYFNFGADFRTDFTATVRRGAFRRWRGKPALEAFEGMLVEVRGETMSINGPSIELLHEMQMQRL